MDRCERTNENGESTFWEGHWLERPIKKGLLQSSVKTMMEVLQEKMKEVNNDTLTRYLKLTTNRISKEELALLSDRMTEYTRMITIYLFDVKNRGESFDYTKVSQVVETGWHVFKLCPMTMEKNERKRVTLKSFDDCLQEKTMEELFQSFAELSTKN